MDRLADEGIAFAMIAQAPIDKLEAWRKERGWDHTWVSSYDTSYHHDWGWTQTDDQGNEGQLPGYSYYLLKDGTPHLTYMTTARGTEAILPTAHIMDRTVYGRQQDWEDSPEGWPQYPHLRLIPRRHLSIRSAFVRQSVGGPHGAAQGRGET